MQLSKEEERSEREERAISEDLEHITETEREDVIMDNDVLVESLEEELEMAHLTDEQLSKMKDLAEKAGERMKELKKKQKGKWDTNNVEHDFETKLAEQSDWQQRGKTSRLAKEERESRKEYREDKWEVMGAIYTQLFLAVVASTYYYCCIRRKRMRGAATNQQYSQVVA